MSKSSGIFCVILSGICFGFLGFFGKSAYQMNILPGELLALRYSMAAVILGALLLVFDRTFLRFTLKEKIISTMLGVFGYALFSSMFFEALKGISASLTVLLLYTYPVMVAVISSLVMKERLTKKTWFSLIIVSVGLFLLLKAEWEVKKFVSFLFGIGAAFFYSLYIVYSRKYLNYLKATASSFYVQLGSGFILSLIHFKNFDRPLFILSNHGLFIFTMAVVCSLLAMTLFLAGLRVLTATETSILSTTEPLSGVLIAVFILKENFVASQIFGGILVIAGMILVSMQKNRALEASSAH